VRKRSFVIVVVEDDRHRMLVYRYLCERGVGERELRIVRSPSGKGSAENWVRQTFVKEVNEYRNRESRAKTALIVIIDADAHSVQDRLNQLDQSLRDNGKHAIRTHREQIARLVPKRNVETWILCLNGEEVDEETDYKGKSDKWNKLIPAAAKTLSRWTRSKAKLPGYCVDSLIHGIRELKRLRL